MTWVFWLYACIAAPWLLCAVFYGLRSPWYRSPMGRSLFGSWLSLSLVLVLAAVYQLIELPHTVAVALAVAVLGAVGVAGLVQLITVLALQRLRRSEEPAMRRRP